MSVQRRNELKKLSKSIKTGIFDMLRLTDEMLSDLEYVDQNGGEATLIEALENEEFAHFGGAPSLREMIRAYRANPKKSTWSEYKFNVRAMIELAKPAREGEPTERINWKTMAKEMEAKVARLETTLDQYQAANAELEKRCETLIAENGELRGQLKATERFAGSHSGR